MRVLLEFDPCSESTIARMEVFLMKYIFRLESVHFYLKSNDEQIKFIHFITTLKCRYDLLAFGNYTIEWI